MSTPIGQRWQALGFSAQTFATLLRNAGAQSLTEQRLYRISTGRTKPTAREKEAISRLLDCKSFELGI